MIISKITEKEIENQILIYLKRKDIFVWKNQTTGLFDPTKKTFRKSFNPHHIKGVPDILGVLSNGRFLCIEVKRPDIDKKTLKIKHKTQEQLLKKCSDDQVLFINNVKLLGGIAFVADSIDVVIEQLIL